MFEPIRRKDNSLLGTNELGGTPIGRQNATEEQVKEWLDKRFETADYSTGKVFRNINSHFLLDWSEVDIPNPAFWRRDQDLCLIAWPEVESPYKFPEFIYEYDNVMSVPSGLVPSSSGIVSFPSSNQLTILPPLYDDDLNLLNPDVEIRIIKEGYALQRAVESGVSPFENYVTPSGEMGVRVYTTYSPSGLIPVKAKRPGNIYNVPAGEVFHCAPKHWLSEDNQNEVYGKDYLTAGGSGYTIGGSEVGPPAVSGRLQAVATGGMNSTYFDAMNLGPTQIFFDDNFWDWYKWNDDGDEYRKFFFNKIQAQALPRTDGYGTLLHDVKGMSQGGNDDRAWIDPIYYDQVAPSMYHKLFRDVQHCYKVDKCNFAKTGDDQNSSGEVFLIENVGFKKNQYAQESPMSDGDAYCRYRQSELDAKWKSNTTIGGDWDRYCKYLGVPQRAVEFDGNYKLLLSDIVKNFRNHGIYYWAGYLGEEQNAEQQPIAKGYKLVSTKQLPSSNPKFIFGQLNEEEGVDTGVGEKDIPTGSVLFFYTTAAPAIPPISSDDKAEGFIAHKQSKLFAYLWQYTHTGKEKWLVELKDNYVSPIYRYSEFQVFSEIKGGENPFVKDKKFAGKNAGGLRFQLIKNPDSGVWRVEYPYDINSTGFFNIEGGNIQLTGITDEASQIYWPGAKLPPVFVDVPSCLAKGTVRPVGLPGEIIQKESIFWKSPNVIKWDHVLEIHDKLLNPTNTEEKYGDGMEPIDNTEQEAKEQFGLDADILKPGLKGLSKKPQPNHILSGTMQDKIIGTGMVSNGDTPYSDVILLSDILHTRNMVMPMMPYKLTPYIPDDYAEWFDDQVQDFATRSMEPHDLTVKRMGFREPSIYCFMTNNYKGDKVQEDISYTIMVPANQNPFMSSMVQEGFSKGERNKIYRIYHPNGMKWWKDNGLLGCGIQYGDVDDSASGYNELGAKGNGLTQVGTAVVNLFRQNLPLDKEVAACYLRLVPSYAHSIGSSVVKTAGGGRQWTSGNSPFHNMIFNNPDYDNYFKAVNDMEPYHIIDYEAKLLWEEDHMHDNAQYPYNEQRAFCKALEFARAFCGASTFHYKGDTSGKVSKAIGGVDNIFHQYDYELTKRGNFLDNIDVTVKAGADVLTFETGQRSREWYESLMTDFMSGLHSKTDAHGLCTRLDYDEGGTVESNQNGKGMGFACSSGGWAKDHRSFDITNLVRKAYISDRFDAIYNAVVDLKLSEAGEPYNLVVLQPQPNTSYISLGEILEQDRVTESSEIDFYTKAIDGNTGWGTENSINYAIINLKQTPPPRIIEGVTIIDDPRSVPSTRKLRDNCIVSSFEVTAAGTLPKKVTPFVSIFARPKIKLVSDVSGWRLIESVTKSASTEDAAAFTLNINNSLMNRSQFREVMVISNLKLSNFKVMGWTTENWPSQIPMTDPPIYETHLFNEIIVEKMFDKDEGDYSIAFLRNPVTKIYEVLVCPVIVGNINNGIMNLKEGSTGVKLEYKGIFNPGDPPVYTWEVTDEGTENERWFISSGQYAFNSAMNAIILPTIYKFKEITDLITNEKIRIKVASLESLGATMSYVTGRGARATVKIKASGTGPAFDIDKEAISKITENGASQIGNPSGEYYGEFLLPWSCNNPNELKGGYIQGDTPDNANALLNNYFMPKKEIQIKAWKSYCQGLLDIYGEPDHLIEAGEFMAPAFIEEIDSVTGEPLSNNLKFESDIDSYKIPNGGRLPLSIEIQLSTTGDNSGFGNNQYRKQQVSFVPELYVFLRERVPDQYSDKSSTWNLNLG